MNTPRPAGRRFRAEAIPLALAALLAVSLPAYARGGHSGGGHSGGGHSGGAHATRSGGSHGSGSHGSTGRTAHETPGGAGHGGGHDGRHDGGHGGHFDGGHHHFGGGSRIFIGGGFAYDPFFYNFYYPFGYWGGYWGPDYDPYYNARPRSYDDRDEMGALDLDVSPGRTHVFVDGQDLGVVDNFDGWPDYLWLPKGTYDVAFYLDGYKTIARQISIYPGNVIDIDDRMESGPSVRPEDLATKTHERRDERLSEERERERRYEAVARTRAGVTGFAATAAPVATTTAATVATAANIAAGRRPGTIPPAAVCILWCSPRTPRCTLTAASSAPDRTSP